MCRSYLANQRATLPEVAEVAEVSFAGLRPCLAVTVLITRNQNWTGLVWALPLTPITELAKLILLPIYQPFCAVGGGDGCPTMSPTRD